MRKLVVTRADDSPVLRQMVRMTHPIFRMFADRWGADFKILSQDPPIMSDDNLPHFRIMLLKDLLDDYDRIVHFDSDMVINKDCPDPFSLVDKDEIGAVLEDKGSRKSRRRDVIREAQAMLGEIGWRKGYINTGTFVVSKMHQPIFESVNGKYYTGWGSDDAHIGWQINKHGFKVRDLGFKWNHMSMFSESWNDNADMFESHILHFAGKDYQVRNALAIRAIVRIYGKEFLESILDSTNL